MPICPAFIYDGFDFFPLKLYEDYIKRLFRDLARNYIKCLELACLFLCIGGFKFTFRHLASRK